MDRISGRRIYSRVLTGGELGAGKGINKRGGGLSALADNPRTLARVALFRGVHPELFETEHLDYELINEAAVTWLAHKGAVSRGDRVSLSKGDDRNVQGGTNTLKILEVA